MLRTIPLLLIILAGCSSRPDTDGVHRPQPSRTTQRLLADLGSPDFRTRESAQAELIERGPYVRPRVVSALAETESPELTNRLRTILHEIDLEAWRDIRLTPVHGLSVGGGKVHAVASSPDGRWLASGGENGEIVIWDVETRDVVRVLEGHDHWVGAIAFDPHRNRLVSAASHVILWNLDDGSVIERIPAQATVVDWSPDGRWIAFPRNGVTVVDAERLAVHRVLPNEGGVIDAVAFSRDGRRLAFGNRFGDVAVFDPDSGDRIDHGRPAGRRSVEAVAYLGDGRLVTAFQKGLIQCGDVTLEFPGTPSTIAVSPDSRLLAVAGEGGTIHLWDTATWNTLEGKKSTSRKGHSAWVSSIAFTPRGHLVSAGNDGRVILWRGEKPAVLRGHVSTPEELFFTSDGRYLVVSGMATVILDLDRRTERHLSLTGALSPTDDSRFIEVGSDHVEEWDAAEGHRTEVRRDLWENKGPAYVSLSPEGGDLLLVNSYRRQGAALVSPGDPTPQTLGRGWEHIEDHAWGPDGDTLALATVWGNHGEFGELRVYSRTGKELHSEEVRGPVHYVAFHPSGEQLYWGDDEQLHVLDVATWQEIESHPFDAWSFRFLNDKVALSIDREAVRFWAIPQLDELKTFPLAGAWMAELAPDRRHLAVANQRRALVYRLDLE